MPIHILGINAAYHESAACLLTDGRVIAAAEEERFNRQKHGKPALVNNADKLPVQAIQYCLNHAPIGLDEVDHFAYSFSWQTRRDVFRFLDDPRDLPAGSWGTKAGESAFSRSLRNVPSNLSRLAKQDITNRFIFVPHHSCHAASAFFPSPFSESAILVIDGIGEFATTWLGVGCNTQIHKLAEVEYPNSLGFLWEKMSSFLGFSEYDAAKVMGLSSYGEPQKLMPQMKQIVRLRGDGLFEIDNRIMKFRTSDFSSIESLFQTKQRMSDVHLLAVHENIAAALQRVTERIIIRMARRLNRETKSKNLCMAGGVALNCVANAKVMPNTSFQDLYIQPAAHDAGTAVGAAHHVWNQILNKPRVKQRETVFVGPEYSDSEIQETLQANRLLYTKVDSAECVVASLISQGNVVAWFQGRMEFGPRALGHRSILADPRSPVIRDELNRKVKFREVFRPFCPSVLEEDVDEWFSLPRHYDPAYWMLCACKVKRGKQKLIPAVTHVDETSRVQMVSAQLDKRYHGLISEFKRITGIPMVLNTSFNIQEPIVCSPQDAINTFKRSSIDYLVMGSILIDRKLVLAGRASKRGRVQT